MEGYSKSMKNKCRPLPDLEVLKKYLRYDPELGKIYWIKSRGCVKKGSEFGWIDNSGYLRAIFNGQYILVHRLVWLFAKEKDPDQMEIDHINNIRTDNRIDNLRLASCLSNSLNRLQRSDNITGIKGVRWHKRDLVWESHISINKKIKYLGRFTCIESAEEAVRQARIKYHGEFCNHGA